MLTPMYNDSLHEFVYIVTLHGYNLCNSYDALRTILKINRN